MKQTSQIPAVFKFKKTLSTDLSYLLYLPREYKVSGDQAWPLMLFLHGAGERGSNVWAVAKHGPPHLVAQGKEFPFILVSPQCPEGRVWNRDVLLGLLDSITAKYRVDTNRVYLTGLSMGGYGTWDLGLSHPERFAAIAPICGGGELISLMLSAREKARDLQRLPIRAFHGGKDPVVPISESQRMVEAARHAGVRDVQLKVYPEAQHDSWTETYNNPELYNWFLNQSRK